MICEYKADFWTGPDEWVDEEIERLGIKLADVSKAYRSIVMSRFSTSSFAKQRI
jgi:hypothetical protein